MRQLTALDAQFLALETPRQAGHVGGLAVLDPSTATGGALEFGDLCRLFGERLPLLPPMRWKLVEVPLSLDYAYWIEDPDFDLDFHLREIALPAPGSDAQLAEQVARIFSRPLDRGRPLWEAYLIHGLPEGRVALLTKIHHALIDGLSGAEIMGLLLDLSPEGREVPPSPPVEREEVPGELAMLARGLAAVPRWPVRALRAVPGALPNIEEVRALSGIPGVGLAGRAAGRLQHAVTGRGTRFLPGPKLKAPRTTFSGRVSPHRRFTFGQIPLDAVKAVKTAHGTTVNDVIVSICAGAVRRWLIAHDELPVEPLVAQIPISVRSPEQQGTYGNQIMLMSAPLFTDEPDPVERLRLTSDALGEMKERHRAMPARLLQDANEFIPPAVFHRAAQLTFALSTSSRVAPNWNLVISNVPGPQFPLYLAGARLVAQYPVSVVTDGMGLNITVMSYDGHCDFGIVADRDQMPDLDLLIGWLGEELELLGGPPARRRTAAPAPEQRRGGRARVPASG